MPNNKRKTVPAQHYSEYGSYSKYPSNADSQPNFGNYAMHFEDGETNKGLENIHAK